MTKDTMAVPHRCSTQQSGAWVSQTAGQHGFALVSSCGATKPSHAYYTEFLAQLELAQTLVMVGDDRKISAGEMGLPIFWTPSDVHGNGKVSPPPQGSLADVLPWLRTSRVVPCCLLHSLCLKAILRSTQRLDTLCARQIPCSCAAPNEWSATEILLFSDAENEVNLRVNIILREQTFIADRIPAPGPNNVSYIRQSPLEIQAFTNTLRQWLSWTRWTRQIGGAGTA
jgi:hypothetical protein